MSTQNKKGETKNQHYVPQFYQRNFSNDGKTIGAYVIEKDKYIKAAPIKSQSSEDYFYSENMRVEKALSAMEGLANMVIKKIIDNPTQKLSKEDNYTLYVFTMLQAGRTVSQAKYIQDYANLFVRNTLKKIVELKQKNGEEGVDDLTDDIIDGIKLDFDSVGMVAVGTQAQLVNTCIDLQCKILINNTQKSFITSDNPAIVYNVFMERMQQIYALGSRGIIIYMPLTPTISILYYDPVCYKLGERKKKYITISLEKDVLELNKLIVASATNVIYFNPSHYSEYSISNLCKKNLKYRIDERVIGIPEIKSENGNPIIGSYNNPMFCKLSLSFLKELPKYSFVKPEKYDYHLHGLRDIAYYKDELLLKMPENLPED